MIEKTTGEELYSYLMNTDGIPSVHRIAGKLNELIEASNRQDLALAFLLDKSGYRTYISQAIGEANAQYYRKIFYQGKQLNG